MTDGAHASAEARSLELHRLVAGRLQANPALLDAARERVAAWRRDGTVSRRWAEAWAEVLDRPLSEVLSVLVDPGQHARALRQSSPFAGVLSPLERWQALRRLRGAAPTP